ncbi:MAG: hypothetical protein U0169_10175 [Polyangiaceae bacterium]
MRPRVLKAGFLAAALATALFGAWVFRSKEKTDPASAFPKESPRTSTSPRVSEGSAPSPATNGADLGSASAGRPSEGEGSATDAERLRAKRLVALEDARELSRFPPTSRPLDREMTDILKPHARHETPLSLRTFAKADLPEKTKEALGKLQVSFTASTYQLDARTPARVELSVHDADAPTKRHPIRVVATEVVVNDGVAPKAVGTFTLEDSGKGGDAIPGDDVLGGEIDVTRAGIPRTKGKVVLGVKFTVAGIDAPLEDTLDFDLAVAEPARFTDRTVDHLEGGSLVFDLGMDVREPGNYLVRGLLFDRHDTPIGYATANETLAAGEGTVHLRFFGLLFHEAKAEAPYVLRTVTGKKLAGDGEKFDAPMLDRTSEFRTGSYALAQFSTSEWTSTASNARMDALKELTKENPAIVTSKTPTRVIEVGSK